MLPSDPPDSTPIDCGTTYKKDPPGTFLVIDESQPSLAIPDTTEEQEVSEKPAPIPMNGLQVAQPEPPKLNRSQRRQMAKNYGKYLEVVKKIQRRSEMKAKRQATAKVDEVVADVIAELEKANEE